MDKPKSLLIIGAGGNSRVIADVAERSGTWFRVAFLDDDPRQGDRNHPWEIIGPCSEIDTHAADFTDVVVGFGDNALRARWITQIMESGISMATIIADSATVSSRAHLGIGTVVMPGAVVNIGVRTGAGCLINTGATVDHDCELGDCVHVAPGAHVGGDVLIGHRTWIGIGAAVKNGMKIGSDVMVGAGAAVVSDLPDDCTALGVPACLRNTVQGG